MPPINRKEFLKSIGLLGISIPLIESCTRNTEPKNGNKVFVKLNQPRKEEDIFAYISRQKGDFDVRLYRQILGAANEYKQGDQSQGLAAENNQTRAYAKQLIENTSLADLNKHAVFTDDLFRLIQQSTDSTIQKDIQDWKMFQLKAYILQRTENEVKNLLPGLTSDNIALLVRLLSNEELISVGQKIFNPLPGSQIGAKGYLSARVQPNSPTDNPEDIIWQVFDAWSYAVGDLVLGTNPVSSEVNSVLAIEKALFEVIQAFGLENIIPNCVLSHIDIQAEAEQLSPGSSGIWFLSLAGTDAANKTFDLNIEKMQQHAAERKGKYGLYAETGQGADFTNGHGEGFDMVMHESRKYGFLRALKQQIYTSQTGENQPWIHVNDVAGFIGPEVFKSREQLVRCCLEDTVMGKLHGLTIGLDICSTLHMDVSLDDLDWCIEQIMPANPAYLMALPTKNDPMLSYLTTAFHNHLKIRKQFGYKVNDAMWDFFKRIEIIDENNNPSSHFGDPVWVYYQYLKAKGDTRSFAEIRKEGLTAIARIDNRGVPISQGYGAEYWHPEPELDKKTHRLYEDAKISLWTAMDFNFIRENLPETIILKTQSADRKDYVYHPLTGEKLSRTSEERLQDLKANYNGEIDLQIIISDGLNSRAITDKGHVLPYLSKLKALFSTSNLNLSDSPVFLENGRVRAGYACGETIFGNTNKATRRGIIHVIGERPGSGHHNFSAYLTVANENYWSLKGQVDHNITRVVSGISDTALSPEEAATTTFNLIKELFEAKGAALS